MRQADLVVATGSQNNVRAAYESGTPALGVGRRQRRRRSSTRPPTSPTPPRRSPRSKTFDHATSCSSENSVIAVDAIADALVAAFAQHGGVLLDARGSREAPGARCSRAASSRPAVVAQSAADDRRARRPRPPACRAARFLVVDADGVGPRTRSRARSSRRCSRSTALRDFDAGGATAPRASSPTRAPATRSGCTRARAERATRARPRAAGVPRDRQPGALLRDRRQLRQRAAVLAVDGLRHLGRQQLLGQPQRPPLPQRHARRPSARAGARARADRGRAVRRLPPAPRRL